MGRIVVFSCNSYDAVGNRTYQPGAPHTNNISNEMTSRKGVPYTYDANGNTLSKTDSSGTTSCTWDFENRNSRSAMIRWDRWDLSVRDLSDGWVDFADIGVTTPIDTKRGTGYLVLHNNSVREFSALPK